MLGLTKQSRIQIYAVIVLHMSLFLQVLSQEASCQDKTIDVDTGSVTITCTLNGTAFTSLNITRRSSAGGQSTVIAQIDAINGVTDLYPDDGIRVNLYRPILSITVENPSCTPGDFYGVDVIIDDSVVGSSSGKLIVGRKPTEAPIMYLHPDQISGLGTYRNWFLHSCDAEVGFPAGDIFVEILKDDTFVPLTISIERFNSTQVDSCTFRKKVDFGIVFTSDMDNSIIRCGVRNDQFENFTQVYSNNATVSLISSTFCEINNSGGTAFYPHPSNCHNFIQCESTVTYSSSCAPGLCFGLDSVHGCNFCFLVTCPLDITTTMSTKDKTDSLGIDMVIPTVTVSQNSYSMHSGGSVQLRCSVSSTISVTNVFWTRVVGGSSTTIFSTTNTNKYQGSTPSVPSLTILNADSSDAGTYTCAATNAVGTGQSSQTILNVNQLTLPSVTISQNAYTANGGSSVTLGCSISSSATITDVYWRKIVGESFTDIRSSTNPSKYTGVVSGNPSLTISNVDSDDAGNYVCYATNSAGTAQSGTTTLTVISQITNVHWERNVNGLTTTISSTTNINKYSGSTVGTPSLTILNADQSDAGTYRCFASNGVGTGQSATTTTLTVSSVPTVQVLQNSYSGSGGSNIVLKCTVSSSLSSVTSTITRIDSNTNINKYSGSTVSTPSLTINNLEASDAGFYTCFATNNAGTGHIFSTTLTVFFNPPTVTVTQSTYSVITGQSVTLVCTVTSNTQVTNVFRQKNVGGTVSTIQSSTNTNKYTGSTVATPSLAILNAAQSDVGSYTCFASNSAGNGQSAPTSLCVTGSVPTVTVAQPSYTATTGQSVTLGCTVTSALSVNTVYWQINVDGTITTIQSNSNTNKYTGGTVATPSLTIFNAARNDVGSYTCFATSSVGTGKSTITNLSVTESLTLDLPNVTVAQQLLWTVGDIGLHCDL